LLPEGDDGVQRTEKQRLPYREAVGSLLYMTCKTRPNMIYSVNYESGFLDNPAHKNMQDVKRIARYLKEIQTCGIQYTKNFDTLKIKAYSDSDYAGDVIDRKSATGFVIMYVGGPIAWFSKKQNIVAL
jgi:hypothetical protein